MADDYSVDHDELTSNTVLAEIANFADEFARLSARREILMNELDGVDESIKQIIERELPTILDNNGLSSVKTASGLKVSVEEKIQASIRKDMRDKAHAWLETHGHSDIIKTKIVSEFGRNELAFAREVAAHMSEFADRHVGLDESVHPQTLGALVRELLREGEECPLDLLGVARIRKAKIA